MNPEGLFVEDAMTGVEYSPTYKIVRFFQDDRAAEVINRGLTLEQAQAHCRRDDTKGNGWFDGYTQELIGETADA